MASKICSVKHHCIRSDGKFIHRESPGDIWAAADECPLNQSATPPRLQCGWRGTLLEQLSNGAWVCPKPAEDGSEVDGDGCGYTLLRIV